MAALVVEDMITTVVAEHDDALAARVVDALEDQSDVQVVARASSGHDAVEQVLDLMPDSALFDLGLPDLDGVEACRTVHEMAPAAALVVLVGDTDHERAFVALCEGAAACVGASWAPEQIAEAVRGATRGECVLPPAVAGQVLAALDALAGSATPHAAVGRPPSPTATEREVLTCLAAGESPGSIADRFDVTTRLVNLHTGFAVSKLQRWTERKRQLAQLT
jgi:DNA-binding NarL/FixJ family response regulator